VQISDQGPGVEDERLQEIFHPFERGLNDSSVGFGLGLAIAARAVEIHGGTIMAHNAPTGGLTMEISLPHRA
jgi:signal transduction histidine kinase